MKLLTLLTVLLFIPGCQSINHALQDNELLSYIAIKNAVAQYIDSKGDEFDQKVTAQRFMTATNAAEGFIESNPLASIDNVLNVAKRSVNYDDKSLADQLLIDDILLIVSKSINQQKRDKNIPDDYVVSIKQVIEAVRAGARVFLE